MKKFWFIIFVGVFLQLRIKNDKKREEGKPFGIAINACVNKLLLWIYSLLKNQTTFHDIA